jgi:DNA-dependent protein kinase catalytic subunit
MQQALRALRDGKDLLLSTMELYLRDPVVDWQGAAAAKGEKEESSSPLFGTDGIDTSSSSSTASSWEPLRKILLARAKLEGANPVGVLHRDLEKNLHVFKKFNSLGAIMKVVKGEAERPRARLRRRKGGRKGREEMEMLTVAEQVEVLVDLATDPNVLMRQYVGLATYI